jgi:hypothetical protein
VEACERSLIASPPFLPVLSVSPLSFPHLQNPELDKAAEAVFINPKVPASEIFPGVMARRPRRSKNATPEERAAKEAKAAAAAPSPATVTQLPRPRASMLDQEFGAALEKLDESGRQFIKGYMQALLDQRRLR